MSITKRKVMVEKEVTTWKCDFCDTQTDHNSGCCGTSRIMRCSFCGKDACRDHRKVYWENDWEDYPDFCACQDCMPRVDQCEYIARQVAGRYDIWREVVQKVYDNFEEYEFWLEDYEEPKPHEPVDIADLYE